MLNLDDPTVRLCRVDGSPNLFLLQLQDPLLWVQTFMDLEQLMAIAAKQCKVPVAVVDDLISQLIGAGMLSINMQGVVYICGDDDDDDGDEIDYNNNGD